MRQVFKYMAMAAALLASAAALAQETSVSGIKVAKSATYGDNGQGEITIEAFATGKTVKTVTETHMPTDVVLVLDVSGSMSDKISFNNKQALTSGELTVGQTYKVVINGKEYYLKGFKTGENSYGYTAQDGPWSYNRVKGGTYYYKDGNKYYEVYADCDYSTFKKKSYDYRLYYLKPKAIGFDVIYLKDSGKSNNKHTVAGPQDTIYTGTLYTKGGNSTSSGYVYRYGTTEPGNSSSGYEFYKGDTNFSIGDKASVDSYQIYTSGSSTTSKINALKSSVNDFISNLASDARTSGVEHRLSIVKFAGITTNNIGNSTYNGYNYTQIITGFVSAKDKESDLKGIVNALTEGGGTRASDGMIHAKDLIVGNTSRNISSSDAYYKSKNISAYSKVVVMFTDGEPGDYGFDDVSSSGYSNGWLVANNTIKTAKEIKDAGATIYTVGVITSPSDDVQHYLELVSSDYPGAEKGFEIGKWSATRITSYTKENEGFYQMSSGADLSDIFQSIAYESYTGGAIKAELDENTILKDIIDPDFNLADDSGIRIYVAKCTGCTPSTESPDDVDQAEYSFSDETCQVFGNGTGSIVTPSPSSPGFANVKATVENNDGTDYINVNGFSFRDYWCGNEDNNGTETLHAGYKLIIKIPITITNCREDRSVYETNEPDSGIYTDSGEKKVIGFPTPKLYGIVIYKNGLLEGESAIFNVFRKVDGAWTEKPVYTTMIVGDSDEENADIQVVAAMMDGEYKVVEDTAWSWTYENGAPAVEHQLSESDNVFFVFTNTKKTYEDGGSILNAEATVKNVMGSDGSQSAASK